MGAYYCHGCQEAKCHHESGCHEDKDGNLICTECHEKEEENNERR